METTRKLILPSGATCKVRRMTMRDSITLGIIPDTLSEETGKASKNPKDVLKERQNAITMCEVALCDCTSKITRPDGSVFKVVRKPFIDCADDEQNCDLFATEDDGEFIVKNVLELSGFTGAAKEAVRPFPEEQASDGIAGPTGGSVPPAT